MPFAPASAYFAHPARKRGWLMSLKGFVLGLAGVLSLCVLVLLWGRITGRISDLIEVAWCWNTAPSADCEVRAGYSFLIWSVVGIASLLCLGFALDRLVGRK